MDSDTKMKEDMEPIRVGGGDYEDSKEQTQNAEPVKTATTLEPLSQLTALPGRISVDNPTTSLRQPDDGLVAQNARSTPSSHVSTLRKSSFLDKKLAIANRGSKEKETTISVFEKATTGSKVLEAKLAIANRSNAVRERATRNRMARRASEGGAFLTQKLAMANRREGSSSPTDVVGAKEQSSNEPDEEADVAQISHHLRWNCMARNGNERCFLNKIFDVFCVSTDNSD